MLFDRECGNMPRQYMPMGPMPQATMPMGPGMPGQMYSPIVEPTMTQCVQREFFHEVPHVCPKHTHVVNKHIYRHTYAPQYSCSEENQMIDINCGSCSQF